MHVKRRAKKMATLMGISEDVPHPRDIDHPHRVYSPLGEYALARLLPRLEALPPAILLDVAARVSEECREIIIRPTLIGLVDAAYRCDEAVSMIDRAMTALALVASSVVSFGLTPLLLDGKIGTVPIQNATLAQESEKRTKTIKQLKTKKKNKDKQRQNS